MLPNTINYENNIFYRLIVTMTLRLVTQDAGFTTIAIDLIHLILILFWYVRSMRGMHPLSTKHCDVLQLCSHPSTVYYNTREIPELLLHLLP